MTEKKQGISGTLRNSYALRRSMLIHLGVSLILFLVILIFTFQTTVVSANTRELAEAQSSLNQAEILNNTYIRSISDYMIQAMDTYEVQGLLYSAGFTNYLSIRSRNVYEGLADVSDLVSSLELVNFNTRTVLDANGRYSFDTFGDAELLSLLSGYSPSSRTRIYFYPRIMNTAATRTRTVNKSVISLIFYFNKAGALVVNLDAELYQRLVLSNYQNQTTAYELLNSEGAVFASSGTEKISNLEDIESQVFSAESPQGSFTLQGGRVTVTYRRSANMGVTYLAVTPMDGIFPGSRNFRLILLLTLVFFAASLLLSFGLAWLSSKPIRKLHSAVSQQADAGASASGQINEFRFIENAYQSVVESNQSLREQAERYQRDREDQMFLNLMNPASPSLRPSAVAAAELDAQLPGNMYRVIAMMPDRKSIALEQDAQQIRKILAETAGGLLSSLGTVRVILPPSFQVLFIINNDQDPANAAELMNSVLPACKAAFGQKTFFMGVGCQVSALDELESSYQGAEEALQQAYVRRIAVPVHADALSFPDLHAQAYDPETDTALSRAIRHMDPQAAEEVLRAFVERISGFSHNQFVRNLLHLSVSLYNLENSLQIEVDEVSRGLEVSTVTHWDAEDALAFFIRRTHLDIAQLSDMKKQRSSDPDLVAQVNEMIENNLYNPDFSINQIADSLSFSVNYLRSLYKTAAGESLSGRITRRRLETACDLLDHTDETIDSITDRLGFSTRNYFFTFFKKHMGMTPTQYRNREL